MSRRSHTFLLALLLIDLPVFVAVAALGVVYGFQDTYHTISAWRTEHLWSYLPSLLLICWLIRKRWQR